MKQIHQFLSVNFFTNSGCWARFTHFTNFTKNTITLNCFFNISHLTCFRNNLTVTCVSHSSFVAAIPLFFPFHSFHRFYATFVYQLYLFYPFFQSYHFYLSLFTFTELLFFDVWASSNEIKFPHTSLFLLVSFGYTHFTF